MPVRPGPPAPKPVPYDHGFYNEISPYSVDAARVVVPIVIELVKPASVIDVGCGTGAWLASWQSHGVDDFLGLDGDYVDRTALHIDSSRFRSVDLEHPPTLDRRFDLAMSVEVAEHLEPHAAKGFVQFLTDLAPVVLFSAAPPGQGGVDHVNEQWPSYWARLFADQGFRAFDIIRPRVWIESDVVFFYAQNLLVFAADDRFADVQPALPLLADPDRPEVEVPMPLVHPGLFATVIDQTSQPAVPASLSSLLRKLPRAAEQAARHRLKTTKRRTEPTEP